MIGGEKESATMGVARLLAASVALLIAGCGSAEAPAAPAPEVARLWPGAAPGTESWSGAEVEVDADLPAGKTHIVTNVTVPTLTVIRPAPGRANGTAVLVAPGGAFRALAWDLEGTEVARWLAERGITAFVLKYRVRPPADGAGAGTQAFDEWWAGTKAAREVAIADARQALRLIRTGAGRYGLKADRVGMIGFSAGAMVTMGAVLGTDPAVRPDFAAPVYGAMAPDAVPAAGAPPLFIVAAQDDPQVPPAKSVAIFDAWTAAHLTAELHLYEKGGHGFGMRARNMPADAWPRALEAWLVSRGLMAAAAGTVTSRSQK
jgi:acetyl esterase/lipase